MSFYCHLLYAYLQTKLKKPACQLVELASKIAAGGSPLPSDTLHLSELLVSLSDKGVVIFLKNHQHVERSWVVVEKEALLKDIIGTLFAPEDFIEHSEIASNTGIVRASSLQKLFPQYDLEMLVGFLESLEFGHRVNLSGITTNLQPISTSSTNEDLLLFTYFLKLHRPDILTSEEQLSFGWCLGCREHDYQYFPSRFLHVLLLRLAYTFPLASENIPPSSPIHGLEQRCTVWKNGICWNNVFGIKTLVEVIQQNRWVVVAMSHNKDYPMQYSKHRSAVIRLVLDLQKQLAPDLDTSECLISPSLLQQWPFEHLPDTNLFTIKDVARSMLLHTPFILSYDDGRNALSTQEALLVEPYNHLSPSSVCELMDNSKADQPVPPALLSEVKKCCQLPQLEPQSHACLRECVDKLSMFAGRNPVVSSAHKILYIVSQFVYVLKCVTVQVSVFTGCGWAGM